MTRNPDNHLEHENDIEDDYMSLDIVSSTECTGMFYKPPINDEEVEGYTDIYHVPQQKDINAQKAETPEKQEKISSVRNGREQ